MFKFAVLVRVFQLLSVVLLVHSEENNLIQSTKEDCHRIFTDELVILESPGYPSGYPPNLQCSYIFKGPLCPTYFNFQFLDFNLISSEGCVNDRLEIHEQDALCGSKSGIKIYFSQEGVLQTRFISDGQASGRGFRILVTRLPCDVKQDTTTTDPNIAWETTPFAVGTPRSVALSPPGSSLSFCCANSYNSKRFLLSSPGFPYNNAPSECIYHIYRANSNVCRLRIHFLYFLVGEQNLDYGCTKGFLKIDGKFICGCHVGLKLISAFDSRRGNDPKVLTFKNNGFPENVFRGFALEIIQDECPKRLAPTNNSYLEADNLKEKQPQFYFYKDKINRVVWPSANNNNNNNHESVIERALLVRENTEILDDNDNEGSSGNFNGGAVRNVYFFEAPDDYDYGYNVRNPSKETRDVEETTYTDTSVLKANLPEGYDNYKCKAWGELQWAMLTKDVLWQQMPKCGVSKPTSIKCEDARYIRGYIQSPGYPNYYPEKVNVCYRFRTQPSFCAIRLMFVDFDLQDSFQCLRDYLLLGGKYRYCGRSLYRSVLTFDLRNKQYEDISFTTNGYYCGRGFRGIYEQIPCNNIPVPVTPPNPVYPARPPPLTPPIYPTTPYPPILPPPPNPQLPCSRNIQEDFFILEINGYSSQPRCVFNILKRNPNVCRLSLTFLDFNLPCGSEHLFINNRRYCGQINGQTLNVNFNQYMLLITYERSTTSPAITGLRFRINGRQLSTGCDPYEYPNVPPERLLVTSNYTYNNDKNYMSKANDAESSSKTFSEKKFDDTCGLIVNATEGALATSICKSLISRNSNIECVPITAEIVYVPYNSTINDIYNSVINEINSKNSDNVEELGVNEVSCDDIDRIIANK